MEILLRFFILFHATYDSLQQAIIFYHILFCFDARLYKYIYNHFVESKFNILFNKDEINKTTCDVCTLWIYIFDLFLCFFLI